MAVARQTAHCKQALGFACTQHLAQPCLAVRASCKVKGDCRQTTCDSFPSCGLGTWLLSKSPNRACQHPAVPLWLLCSLTKPTLWDGVCLPQALEVASLCALDDRDDAACSDEGQHGQHGLRVLAQLQEQRASAKDLSACTGNKTCSMHAQQHSTGNQVVLLSPQWHHNKLHQLQLAKDLSTKSHHLLQPCWPCMTCIHSQGLVGTMYHQFEHHGPTV